ncbi:MAG: hypothetical protein AB7K52_15895 [Phycisphaerales bacterium]
MPSSLAHSAPRNPLDALRSRQRTLTLLAAIIITPVCIWSLWPLGNTDVPLPSPPEVRPRSLAAAALRPLDLAAFSAPVWDAPPPPPPPVIAQKPTPAPPPPPPLKLQLLGIVREESLGPDGAPVYLAAIYDETTDKLLMLRAGDTIGASGAGRIARVHADAVELTDPSGPRRLALRQPIAPIPGLSAAPTPSAKPGTGKP